MNKLFALISGIALSLSSFAQDIKLDWPKSFGAAGDVFHRVVEAGNGSVIAVGESSAQTSGGKDGLIVIVNHSTGALVKEVRYGGAKDDVIYDIAPTPQGFFLLVGYTESIGKGSRDGWLLLIDEKGRKLEEKTIGGTGKDELRQIEITPDGTAMVLAGFKNDQKDGDAWLIRLSLKFEMVWEKQLGNGKYGVPSGLALSTDGGAVFSGNTRKGDQVYAAKIDARGAEVWDQLHGKAQYQEALDLINTRDGNFALAGLTKSKGDADAWILKIARDGNALLDNPLSNKDFDVANALIQLNNGNFYLLGASNSYRTGARSTKALLIRAGSDGRMTSSSYWGGGNDETWEAATLLHDGRVVVVGKEPGKGAFIGCLPLGDQDNPPIVGVRDQNAVEIAEIKLNSQDNKTIQRNENAYLSFRLNNKSGAELGDIKVEVEDRTGTSRLEYWAVNYLGQVGSERSGKIVRIPVRSKDITNGEHNFNLKITSGDKYLTETDVKLVTRVPLPASLQLAGYNYFNSTRSDEVTLRVTLENAGDANSGPTEVVFTPPTGIRPSSTASTNIGPIAARSKREIDFLFTKTPQFTGAAVNVVLVVKEGGAEKIRKTLEGRKGGIGSGGAVSIWTDPDPNEVGNRIKTNSNQKEIKMNVLSEKGLEPKSFKLRVNGVEMEGSKFNEQELSAPKRDTGLFSYTYRNKIPLILGVNRVEVVIDGKPSESIFIEYAPQRSNLFILAIGPAHSDLLYTAKDAKDFAEVFRNQGGMDKLYPNVHVQEITTPETTNLTGIKAAMYDLNYMWKDGIITPNDVVVVFLSSHGKMVENRFKILQSGYNPKYENLSVDYKTDVLEVLDRLKCKKLIFLDACHSGGAKDGFDGLSKAVIDLANTHSGVSTLSSCKADEKSYEAQNWQNGAFTEAIMEAFSNNSFSDARGAFQADVNNDRIINLGELYDFLQRRVPQLVKTVIPNAPTSQAPFMPEDQLDRSMPLYFIQK
ncbi:MAG TPA: caspase family protein [Haliscomenobacter sp.]|uniref:caspase family protein n=1 Tax=Haliscomenobacter sp. TaxID=2717303 RepID=UPI002CB482A6|nr:caspase family protein [Haliscomenobacter sp.]HOY20258.1 caspase family protein [Haliscomenobacter sp.]